MTRLAHCERVYDGLVVGADGRGMVEHHHFSGESENRPRVERLLANDHALADLAALHLRVSGFEFRGFGFRISGFRVSNFGVSGFGFRISG